MSSEHLVQEFVFVVRRGDDVRNEFIIDSRDYADRRAFEAAGLEAFDVMTELGLHPEVERHTLGPTSGRFPFPTWEEYKSTRDI